MTKTGEYAKRSIPIFFTFHMMKARITGPAYNSENVKRNFGVGPNKFRINGLTKNNQFEPRAYNKE